MRFVLDASVTLTWLLADGKPADCAYSGTVLGALKDPESLAIVPVTWGLEVANVLARGEARGVLTEAQSKAFLELLSALAIHGDEATFGQSLEATIELARRHHLSAYDASYLELALRGGLPMATLDDDLAKAARRAGVERFKSKAGKRPS